METRHFGTDALGGVRKPFPRARGAVLRTHEQAGIRVHVQFALSVETGSEASGCTFGQLPPVVLYKVGGAYFVEDGNHRISVARYQGVDWMTPKWWNCAAPHPRRGSEQLAQCASTPLPEKRRIT